MGLETYSTFLLAVNRDREERFVRLTRCKGFILEKTKSTGHCCSAKDGGVIIPYITSQL